MTNKNFFYARVSSITQSVDRQKLEFKKYCEANNISYNDCDIRVEHASGKDFKRPVYQDMKKNLRDGDVLYIQSIDRLGRNKDMVLDEWRDLTKNKKVDIVVLDMPLLDTRKEVDGMNDFVANLVLQILTYVADQEREKIRERQKQGIAAAKGKGKHLGRPRKNYDSFSKEEKEEFEFQYDRWKRGEQTAVQTFETLKLSKATFYRIVKEYEQLLESN